MATVLTVVDHSAASGCWRLDRRGSVMLRDPKGRSAVPRGRRARAIIAYLATRAGERVSRDRLIELLWVDRGEAQARASLRQSLLEIRRAAPDLINSDHDQGWIDSARLIPSDLPDECSPGEQLLGDLEGITDEYDEWLRCERAAVASKEWDDLEHKVGDLLADGKGAEAPSLIERMRRIDPYNEDWLRLAMQAEAQAGHPAGIQTRFRELDELLKCELGVSLSTQTRALHDDLLADLSAPIEWAASDSSTNVVQALSPPGPSKRHRYPWLATAGIAVLVTTLGLSQSAPPASAEPARIAVLPFRALGGVDPALAEGMADEVLGDLSRQGGLRTIGRTSSWMFRDKAEDLRRVGRKLDVRYIVEGSLRQTGSGLRLNVALIDTRDASTLWSGRFASQSGDAQRIEDAASGAIVQRLGLTMDRGGRHADPRAYVLYVRAKSLIRDRNWPKMGEARDLLVEATKINPEFAPAWAQLGGAINFLGDHDPASGGDQKVAAARALAAARKAIALDPNLAEGHQMLAFILGFGTKEGREHLRRALQLDPNNPQTIYWWSNAAGLAGNHALQEKAARRALVLDPLWRRPVEVVASIALAGGRRSEAYGYVDRLRAIDPGAALEVEMSLAHAEGDLSRVVAIGRAEGNLATVQGSAAKQSLALSLKEMGYVREALMVSGASPFDRLVCLRKVPDRGAIFAETREWVGHHDEPWELTWLLLELARTARHADIAALFDRPGSTLNELRLIEDGNREYRSVLAPIIGQALLSLGRQSEATEMFRAGDEANRVFLANTKLPPSQLAEIAVGESILGRNARAISHLEQAVAKGWFTYEGLNYRLDEMPGLMRLRGDPRFDRLVRITNARRERERSETEALGLI